MEILPKYFAKELGAIKNSPGTWDSHKIGVFRREGKKSDDRKDEQVGEYIRHYSFLDTFHWFTQNGKDFALFSAPGYTATRIMELPSCRDLGGEKFESNGFCPVEFYVPSYVDRQFTAEKGTFKDLAGRRYRIYEPDEESLAPDKDHTKAVGGLLHESFALVAGCVWGDDNSWKIEYLDLSQAEKGILTRDARFGYIELPKNLKLRQAVTLDDDSEYIRIAHEVTFDRESGKKLE